MAVYNVSLMDSGHLPPFRRINPRALFAFLVQFSTCLLHLTSSCSSTPRYEWGDVFTISSPFNLYLFSVGSRLLCILKKETFICVKVDLPIVSAFL